jgi:hypothetical protein
MNDGDKSVSGAAFPGSLQDIFAGIHGLLENGKAGPFRVVYIEVGAQAANGAATNGALTQATTVPSTSTGVMPGTPGYELEWNLQGHAVIGYMAQSILQDETPEAFRALQEIIANDPHDRGDIGDLAMWPDQIKHPPPGKRPDYDKLGWIALGKKTQPWHFVDIPYHPGTDAAPVIPSGEPTILEGLPQQLRELADPKDAESAANALAFVVHLTGDLHQPLHCACLASDRYQPPKYDMGGNLLAWGASEKNPSSLHKLWDDSVAAKPAQVATTVAKLLEKYPRSAFKNETSRDLSEWAIDSHMLARKAYDRFLKDTTYDEQSQRYSAPSKAYRAWAIDVSLERAALAAYRLADLLAERLHGGGNGTTNGKKKPPKRRS